MLDFVYVTEREPAGWFMNLWNRDAVTAVAGPDICERGILFLKWIFEGYVRC
jgi:hypothetical protein